MTTNSIYIPCVNISFTEADIKAVFYNHCIGEVKRVDFLETDPCKPDTRKVFVHMSYYYNSPLAHTITHLLEIDHVYKFQFSYEFYWLLFKAKKPIQDSVLNIHQLAENMRLLENRFAEKEAEITALKKQVADLTVQVRYSVEPEWIYEEGVPNSPLTMDDLETGEEGEEEENHNDVLNTGFISEGTYYDSEL